MQIISAVSGGITDLSFDAVGYAWQIMNCILTASYSVCYFWMQCIIYLYLISFKNCSKFTCLILGSVLLSLDYGKHGF